jgi:ABC-type oligopeptide transport system substrate-binding subunit/class 3 adenylate cyclase
VEVRDERRVVTALFADLVGSTALGERMDPEELMLIVGEAVATMVTAVEAFGGTIKDLAGDGVLALFGAPVAHEDDQERAIRAGMRIVEDIGSFAQKVEEAWGVGGVDVRVGVNTGPVVTGALGAGSRIEYAAMGDAVNVAARLQSHARPGSILVGETTREAVSDVFAWGPPRALELKGKAEPVTASEVVGVTGIAGRRRDDADAGRIVGRDHELAAAGAALEAARAGAGAIVVVTGEPGIGKTRLVGELRSRFLSVPPPFGRALWLVGRCVSYGEGLPYAPFRDLLRSWLGLHADDPELRVRITLRRHAGELFGDHADEVVPYLAALLGLGAGGENDARLAELSPEALQYRTFEVIGEIVERLCQDGPVAVQIEDLHWADPTSLQLLERIAEDTDRQALLLVCTSRTEPDHPSWRILEDLARRLPHRTTTIALEALSASADRAMLAGLVGADTVPEDLAARILEPAEGNPLFIEELVRSMIDAGALRSDGNRWRLDPDVEVAVPPTVEQLILARIDRLDPGGHRTITSASVLGRQFGLPLLEAVADQGDLQAALTGLMRMDLLREGRRWPEPEYRFKHALIQEAAYRTLVTEDRARIHRRAAEWLEHRPGGRPEEIAGVLAYHWLGAGDETQAIRYLTIAGDRARQEYALDEAVGHYRQLLPLLERRGERQAIALVLFKLALALHMSLRFGEANEAYQRGFEFWSPPPGGTPTATLRMGSSYLPDDPDPRSAIAWPNIQLCMQLFDRLVEQWPERTIVPSLAERWEIAEDGLTYRFTLREGLRWSDGTPLTAHDQEFGIKRVLDPDRPGSSVAIYFALEQGQEHYLRQTSDASGIGVRALDDRTIEFRLTAPAPYFMSVMNRPDGAPQPRHAIEAAGDDWTRVGEQVVSGAFRIEERDDERLVLTRRTDPFVRPRPGNVARVEIERSRIDEGAAAFEAGRLDMVSARYTPRLADLVPGSIPGGHAGPATWSGYLAFDHANPAVHDVDLRRALAHALDRDALAEAVPVNMVLATGGIVPPALQGHTPAIALRFDPDRARALLAGTGFGGALAVAALEDDLPLLEPVVASWRSVLGVEVELRGWSFEGLATMPPPRQQAPIYFTGWLPGYADPEYFLRLLFHSDSRTNEGGFAEPAFDDLIERARRERSDRERLELFHQADRFAVADRVAVIPLVYGRSYAIVKPSVRGWWEFGKTSSNFADLQVEAPSHS